MTAGHPRTQFDLVEDFWQQLIAVDDRILERARRRETRRRLRRTLVLAILAILLLGAIGLAAGTLLRGADAPRVYPKPTEIGIGLPQRGRTLVLPERELDPVDGLLAPPWGMRIFFTDGDNACLQAGRIVGGRLVALGVSGAFGNDGLAHAIPLEPEGCTGVRAGLTPRIGIVSMSQDTSGLAEHRDADPANRRTVVLGAASRGVTSVVLVAGKERIVHRVANPVLPAYIFVLAGDPPEPLVVLFRYRDGLVCTGYTPMGPEPDRPLTPECIRRRANG
jgi:hypothetical protein